MSQDTIVDVYTDGSCDVHSSDKRGGWAVLIQMIGQQSGKLIEKEFSSSWLYTTNNRMELTAILEALHILQLRKGFIFNIYTDSRYCMLSLLNKKTYESNGFKNVQNEELIKRIYKVLDMHNLEFHTSVSLQNGIESVTYGNNDFEINFIKVPAHANNEGNNRVDKLAVQARKFIK